MNKNRNKNTDAVFAAIIICTALICAIARTAVVAFDGMVILYLVVAIVGVLIFAWTTK